MRLTPCLRLLAISAVLFAQQSVAGVRVEWTAASVNGNPHTCASYRGLSSDNEALACVCGDFASYYYQSFSSCTKDKVSDSQFFVDLVLQNSGNAQTFKMSGGHATYIKDDPENCPVKSSNPVVYSRGEKYYHHTDMVTDGYFPLVFERHYRVRAGKNDTRAMALANWNWGYIDKRIIRINTTKVNIVRGDGSGAFRFSTSNSGATWTDQDEGFYNELERIPSSGTQTGWRFLPGNGGSEEYDIDGYLIKNTTREGLSHSISYSKNNGIVASMVIENDQTNEALLIYLEDNRPISVIQLDYVGQSESGRPRVDYEWDSLGRLQSVSYPDYVQAYEYDSTANSAYSTSKGLITGVFELSSGEYSAGPPYPESKRYSKVTYDSLGRVTSSALWDGTQKTEELTFEYKLTDGTTDWDWSTHSKSPTTRVTNADGVTTTYEFSTSAFLDAGDTLNDWRLVGVDGEADSATGCAATSAATTYNNGYIDTTTDKKGTTVTKRIRDGQGRITTLKTGLDINGSETADSQKIEFTFNSTRSLPDVKTYYGHTSGNWVAYRSETFTYDANNRLSARTVTELPSNATRTWTYDIAYHSGTLVPSSITVKDELQHTISKSNFDAAGVLTSSENKRITTSYGYDTRGRITSQTTAGKTTEISYKPNGLVERVTSPDGSWLEYSYNSAHQLTGIENQSAETITLTPSVLNGQWTSAAVQDGITKVRAFDALGRVMSEGSSTKTLFTYDANDNVQTIVTLGDADNTNISTPASYDAANHVTYREFDGQNRIKCSMQTSPTPPTTCMGATVASTKYTYDDQGNIKTVTDAEGNETTYTYNGFGDLITQASPDTGTTKYEYDDAGNLETRTKGFGTADAQVISYAWDNYNRLVDIDYSGSNQDIAYTYDQEDAAHGTGMGRLTRVQVGDNPAVFGSSTTDYKYNAMGNIVRKTESLPGPTTSSTDDISQVTDYVYSTAGVLEKTIYPDGLEITAANTGSKVTSLTDTSGTPQVLISFILHEPFGGINRWNTGSAYINEYFRNIDADGRISYWGIAADQEQAVIELDYDAYGNISRVHSYDSVKDEAYEYDDLSRLTKVTAAYGRISYGYDAVGNRSSVLYEKQDPMTQAWEEFYTEAYDLVDNSNRLEKITRTKGNATLRTREFGYDARGNIKTDTRQKTGETATVHSLNYGNSDRLDSLVTP